MLVKRKMLLALLCAMFMLFVFVPKAYSITINSYLNLSVTNNGNVGNSYTYRIFNSGETYQIQSGDYLEFDVYLNSANPIYNGGFDALLNSGPVRDYSGWVDQNNIVIHPNADLTGYAKGKWYHRKFAISNKVGDTLRDFKIAHEGDATGNYVILLDNVKITNNDVIKFTIYENEALKNNIQAEGPTSSIASQELTVNSTGPVGIWHFDESSGNTVYDSSPFIDCNNDGTIYGASWTSGKLGSALSFDGVGDHVQLPDSANLNITYAITIEAWVKVLNNSNGFTRVITKGSWLQGGFITRVEDSNSFMFHIYTGGNTSGNCGEYETPPLTVGEWTHVAATYDSATGQVYVYKNGIQYGPWYRSGEITSNNQDLIIGAHEAYDQKGLVLDEIKIYNYALSSEEVLKEYERRPVASWHLDESGGYIAYDETDNNNDGNIYDASWKTYGISNSALSFDGVNDYVDCENSSSVNIRNPITVEAWFKWNDKERDQKIVSKRPSYVLSTVNFRNYFEFELFFSDGTTFLLKRKGTWIPQVDEWYHLVGTFDGRYMNLYINGELDNSYDTGGKTLAVSPYNLNIGRCAQYGSCYFNGLIDEVKIYDFALRDNEIKEHYESLSASLISHWPFNENTENQAYDYGSNNNTGTVNDVVWTSGKFDRALDFDGCNDCVMITDSESLNPTNGITLEAWVKVESYPVHWISGFEATIISKYNEGAGGSYLLSVLPDGKVKFLVDSPYAEIISTQSLSLDTWYHIVATFDGTNKCIYIDSILNGPSIGGGLQVYSTPVLIGASRMYFEGFPDWQICIVNKFVGVIDEVKIYNRALTEDEIIAEHTMQKPVAIARSEQSPWREDPPKAYPAENAADYRKDTRWSSEWDVDPQWIYIDFGNPKTFTTVKLHWQAAYGKRYKIQISDNPTNWYSWHTIFEVTNGNGGIDEILVGKQTARAVRMYGEERSSIGFGYSLWEFTVYK